MLKFLFASLVTFAFSASAATVQCGAYYVTLEKDGSKTDRLLAPLKSFEDTQPFSLLDRSNEFSYMLQRSGDEVTVALANPLNGQFTQMVGAVSFDKHFKLAIPAKTDAQGNPVDSLELWCGQ